MATKKQGSSSKNGGKSLPKYRGLKVGNGQHIKAGQIIARQLGTKIYPGLYTDIGRDFTLFSTKEGIVRFYDGYKDRKFVEIQPTETNN